MLTPSGPPASDQDRLRRLYPRHQRQDRKERFGQARSILGRPVLTLLIESFALLMCWLGVDQTPALVPRDAGARRPTRHKSCAIVI
jgi:hypothetical protein